MLCSGAREAAELAAFLRAHCRHSCGFCATAKGPPNLSRLHPQERVLDSSGRAAGGAGGAAAVRGGDDVRAAARLRAERLGRLGGLLGDVRAGVAGAVADRDDGGRGGVPERDAAGDAGLQQRPLPRLRLRRLAGLELLQVPPARLLRCYKLTSRGT